MSFVTVRHPERGDAEITADEVDQYRAMGFEPVDKAEVAAAKREDKAAAAASEQPGPAATSTDQRLDLVLDELRGLRADLKALYADPDDAEAEGSADGQTVELRGVGTSSATTTPEPTSSTTTTAAPTTSTKTTTKTPKP